MLVAQALRLLLRRWRLVVATLLVAGAVGVLVAVRVPPSYQTQTSLLFLSPGTLQSDQPGGTARRINPFVNFSQDLFVARDVVGARLSGDDVAAELEQAGLQGEYTVAPDTQVSAPIMVVTVLAPTPRAATRSAVLVSDRVRAELEAQQKAAQAPSGSFITSTVISPPQRPSLVRKAQLQAGLVVVAGLCVLGLLLIALDERRRVRRRAASVDTASAAAAGPVPVAAHPRPARLDQVVDLRDGANGAPRRPAAADGTPPVQQSPAHARSGPGQRGPVEAGPEGPAKAGS